MNNKLLARLANTRLIQVLHDSPAPRWVTFSVDFLIVVFVSLLLFQFRTSDFAPQMAARPLAYMIFVGVYALVNLLTGAYKCVVRFSITEDIFKSFWFVILSSGIISLISLFFAVFREPHHMLVGILPIVTIGIMALCLMIMVRIMVKYIYSKISSVRSYREPVIVLGSALNSLSLATTLKNEIDGKYNPVALLSLHGDKKFQKVNDINIEQYKEESLSEIFEKYNCHTLIVLQTQMELLRSGFADIFIRNNIKLLQLNQIDEFEFNDSNDEVNISGHVRNIKIEDLLGRPEIKVDTTGIHKEISDSTVMVTGAAGSIGSEIVRQVARFGAEKIVLVDQAETPMHDMQLEMEHTYPDTKIVLYMADVQNRSRMERAFAEFRPRFVYHAAAYKHVPMMERNPSEAILTNVMGTKNLADLAVQYKAEKFVMISTDKAVNPTNIMGASKRLAEIYVQSLCLKLRKQYGEQGSFTRFITTRFGNVLGSNGSVIPLFRSQIEAGGPVTVTHRDIIRYFMTIPEACSLVLEASCMGHGGEIFLFDMGKPVKIYDLACRMIHLSGFRPNVDIKIVETGLRPGEKLYEELLNDKERTIPTTNEKILIAKTRKYDFDEVSDSLESLITLADKGEIHDMVKTMKEIVPEYISNNSIFQDIDKELDHTAPTPAAEAAKAAATGSQKQI